MAGVSGEVLMTLPIPSFREETSTDLEIIAALIKRAEPERRNSTLPEFLRKVSSWTCWSPSVFLVKQSAYQGILSWVDFP